MCTKNKKIKLKILIICFIILLSTFICYLFINYNNKSDLNKTNAIPFTQNFQNLKEEITAKNTNEEPDTNTTIIQKANIDYIPKVSVIIPVYNTEKYLKECLDSVVNQSLKEIEIICIDDNSSDNSLQILKEYAQKDNRIKIIENKSNLGAGPSRNKGIKLAKGEYIGFLDSDDFYFNNNCLEEIFKKNNGYNYDVIGSNHINYNQKEQNIYIVSLFNKEKLTNYKELQYHYDFWSYFYKKDLIINNNIFFPNYLRYEDPPWFLRVILKSNNIFMSNIITNVYRSNYKTVKWTEQQTIDMLKGQIDCLNIAINNNLIKLYNNIIIRLKNFNIAIEKNINSQLVIKELQTLLNLIEVELIEQENIPYIKIFLNKIRKVSINKEIINKINVYLTECNLKNKKEILLNHSNVVENIKQFNYLNINNLIFTQIILYVVLFILIFYKIRKNKSLNFNNKK